MSIQITSSAVFELPKKQVEVLRCLVISEGEGCLYQPDSDIEYQLLCNLLERAENLIISIMGRYHGENS